MDALMLIAALAVLFGALETSRRWESHIVNLVVSIVVPLLIIWIASFLAPQAIKTTIDIPNSVTVGILSYIVGLAAGYFKKEVLKAV